MILDPVGVDDPPVIRGTERAAQTRLRMLAGLILAFAMLAVLWGLTKEGGPADEEPLSSETPEVRVGGADPLTSTRVVTTTASTTTASTTTGAETTASEQLFVNGVQGPVLGDGVDGVLVQLFGWTMRQIDLSTGAIELIDLEHPVFGEGPELGIVINGELVTFWESAITITDLSDGSQREPRDMTDGLFEMHIAGLAGDDSIWLVTEPGQDEQSVAIEVDLDGEVRRRIEVPRPFSIEWADGDELILGSVDGSFRYDTATGAIVRMPGAVVAFEPGLVVTASCDESLQCDVLVDRGSGAEVVDWLSTSDELDGLIDLSPDLSGALYHVYTQGGAEFTFIDLHTGSRVDLGSVPVDPYRGVVWLEGSRWIIGQPEGYGGNALAIDTQTGEQFDLVLPSLITDHSFLPFISSN
jgi:hypothetical protein